jgi:hypothetical protein
MFPLIIVTLISASAMADDTPASIEPASVRVEGAAKPKFGPRDVELRVNDGSVIRGEIRNGETIALKTAYGRLVYPMTDIIRIKCGSRLSPPEGREIEAAIANLDSDDFDKRASAQTRLELFGPIAIPMLQASKDRASTEAKNRIEKILKKLFAKGSKPQTEDSVRTAKFEIPGSLEIQSVDLRTRLGDLMIKIEDVESIRWLCRGTLKALDLPVADGLKDWLDTGLEAAAGESVAINCTGDMNLFGSVQAGPDGHANWGAQPFLTGALIGKFGLTGTPFLIGSAKKVAAHSSERLYVKLFSTPNQFTVENFNQCSGSLSIKVATGACAEDMRTEQ